MSLNPLSESGNLEKKPNDYKVVYPTTKHESHVQEFIGSLKAGDQDLVMAAIDSLGQNPRPHGHVLLKPAIPALSMLAHYRIKQGDFRIFYDIRDDNKKVYILAVRLRNEKTYRR